MTDMPGYPAPETPAEPAPRPAAINGAFWAYIVATLIGIAGAILLFFARDAVEDALRRADAQNASHLTDTQIQQAATIGIVTASTIAIIVALLHLLFAFKLRAGRNWARIVLTVLTVLQTLSLLTGQSSALGYVSVGVSVLGVILSFLPEANQYIAATKLRRQPV